MKLEYYVYNEDFNEQQIIKYNVFNHVYFVKYLCDMFKNIEKEEKRYNKENNLSGLITHKQANEFKKYMEAFEDNELKRVCRYYFWTRSEYEIVLTTWTPSIEREELLRLINEDKEHMEKWGSPAYRYTPNLCVGEKIDIYGQLRLNWDIFKKYVFENEKEIKKLNRENLKNIYI